MAAELTTLKHSSLWNDRELGNKLSLLQKEVEVMNGQLQAKGTSTNGNWQTAIVGFCFCIRYNHIDGLFFVFFSTSVGRFGLGAISTI